MAYTSQQISFVETYLPYAETTSQQTGLPVDFILGQAAEESGWGTSTGASQNNLFNISPGGNLASYNTVLDNFNAYSNLINNNYDTSALAGAPATTIAGSLQAQGYAKDPNYANAVGGTTSTIDGILSSLGINTGTTSGTGTAQVASNSGIFGQLETWLTNVSGSVVFVILGIVLLIGALYMFAVQSGAAPSPSEIAKGAALAA